MSAPQAYPLQWPAGKPRTPAGRRERGKFKSKGSGWKTDPITGGNSYDPAKPITVAVALSRLQTEIDRLGGRYVVVSSNLELRLDGLPRSGQRKPDDPGVAVYFQLRGKPLVLACDHYETVADNIAAVAAHIDAMRTTERHGVGSLEQMFAGFTALPSAVSPDDWREPLGHPTTLEQAEANYRDRMKYAHPDVNDSPGAEAVAAKLNAAIAAAREHFKTT